MIVMINKFGRLVPEIDWTDIPLMEGMLGMSGYILYCVRIMGLMEIKYCMGNRHKV